MNTLIKTPHYNAKLLFITVIFTFFARGIQGQVKDKPLRKHQKEYSTEQAISYNAQLNTAAFSGLAFLTGNFGADCFFPPGKVADFFGFQYMRDNDKNAGGHNTSFLTLIAENILHILNDEQISKLTGLASIQAPLYDEFALKRMILIKAFRQQLDGTFPAGMSRLDKAAVIDFCSDMYELDAEITFNRAVVTANIIKSLTDKQKKEISQLDFSNSATWHAVPERLDKRKFSHREHVCIMTYASEFFSWYAGSLIADTYFCPERHGTYFGAFFLKDYPAMGKPGYNISTSLTGDKGSDFIKLLEPDQADMLKQTVTNQERVLNEIVEIRTTVSGVLRKALSDLTPDKDSVFLKIRRYGALDGELSYNYAVCFSGIYSTMSTKQKEELAGLRDLDVTPDGAYLFSDRIDMPGNINADFLFR